MKLSSLVPLLLVILGLARTKSVEAESDFSWRFKDLNGTGQQLVGMPGQKATVLVFLQPDCPISNQYAPLLNRLEAEYHSQGIAFFRVYPDVDLTDEEIAQHTKNYGYRWPALRDPGQKLVRKTAVTVTPEAVVLDSDGTECYRGRIDNRYVDFGKKRPRATRNDLRMALEAVLHGKSIKPAVTKAIGCYIDLIPAQDRLRR
jgi:thiol-disulfide isomerase/thioredoxin